MNYEAEIEQLQIQTAFQESALSDLNEVVTRQDEELRVIKKQLRYLNEMLKRKDEGDPAPTNEPPPHY
ncbi:SlyX family protein [Umboniibacter marinipuniceus]|uniref:SlyX protein n=1 Tax=Umboniibacter marinipuniceus TaxID=569599 RepID=A0A3M0A4F9_9GAMM|nr:SlyX family protein [Umboniibacter marinipuniceus]RMA79923.1 SlyX protein [Umboniibacter marinipuniceus]